MISSDVKENHSRFEKLPKELELGAVVSPVGREPSIRSVHVTNVGPPDAQFPSGADREANSIGHKGQFEEGQPNKVTNGDAFLFRRLSNKARDPVQRISLRSLTLARYERPLRSHLQIHNNFGSAT